MNTFLKLYSRLLQMISFKQVIVRFVINSRFLPPWLFIFHITNTGSAPSGDLIVHPSLTCILSVKKSLLKPIILCCQTLDCVQRLKILRTPLLPSNIGSLAVFPCMWIFSQSKNMHAMHNEITMPNLAKRERTPLDNSVGADKHFYGVGYALCLMKEQFKIVLLA